MQIFKSYSNLKISKFWFFVLKGDLHDFLTKKLDFFV